MWACVCANVVLSLSSEYADYFDGKSYNCGMETVVEVLLLPLRYVRYVEKYKVDASGPSRYDRPVP